MNVTFTRREFARLIELAYMGEWVATAMDGDDDDGVYKRRYNDLMQKLYTTAASESDGCPEYVGAAPDMSGAFTPSERLASESPAAKALDRYENDTFWEELISRLAERDYSRATLRDPLPASMTEEELGEHKTTCTEQIEDRYRDEFVKHDLGNVIVLFDTDKFS